MASMHVVSHWHQYFDQIQFSPQEFFGALDSALAKRAIPEAKPTRVIFAEGAKLGGKREYVRVARRGYSFDVCAAPFGSGFFVSWWCSRRRGLLYAAIALVLAIAIIGLLIKGMGLFFGTFLALIALPAFFLGIGFAIRRGFVGTEERVLSVPIVGLIYRWLFNPFSYYQVDSELSFEKAVHAAVLEAVDTLTDSKGIRGLSEFERKPMLRELAKR